MHFESSYSAVKLKPDLRIAERFHRWASLAVANAIDPFQGPRATSVGQ